MSEKVRNEELWRKSRQLLKGPMKHVRAAALSASLVPLGAVLASTADLRAQPPDPTGEPPVSVPEPSTMLLLGTGLAGLYVAKRRHENKDDKQ